jgi:hypothetical protein
MDFEQAKKLCIAGELTTIDAAFECGMSASGFYRRIRSDATAYIMFLSNTVKRSQLKPLHKSPDENIAKCRQKAERKEKEHYEKVMKQYKSKKIASMEQRAREMGVSYGYYVAMMKGTGRVD